MKPSTANAGAVQSTPSEHAVVALETLGAKIKQNSEGEAVAVDLSDKQQVTDADLVHLKGLSNLNVLKITGTRITSAGDDELRQALPNCEIER